MKRINREAIQRMVDASGGKAGGTSGGGGGSLAGYATQAWVNEGFVSIEFFNRLFTVYGPGETSSDPDVVIEPNDLDSTIKNIKAMFGLWTEQYLSALGLNPGGTGSATSLGMLDDVNLTTPTNGQALVYNSTSLKWENQTISTVTALANLTDVLLSSLSDNQTLLYNSGSGKWYNSSLKTINGQSILGSGDISVGGGATGNYLPLAGGTMTGASPVNFTANKIAIDFRPNHSSYNSRVEYMTSGNEALVFSNQNSVTSYIFKCGLSLSNSSDWTTITPSMQIKEQSVYINELIPQGTTPSYNLFVNGTAKIGSTCLEGGNEINSYSAESALYLNYRRTGYVSLAYGGGNVFIGTTTNDNYRLRVAGTGYFEEALIVMGLLFERRNEINTVNSSDNILINYRGTGNTSICAGGGYVGIRKATPSYALHVDGTIYATGEITALSDIRQKNIQNYMQLGVDEVANAPIIKFTWKDPKAEDKGLQVGSIAQYWEKVLPEAVKKDKEGTLSMSYGVVALVAAISTAKKVQEHERRIAELERENKDLKGRLRRLNRYGEQ